jgi:transglutaminase-like putative cysteine protease
MIFKRVLLLILTVVFLIGSVGCSNKDKAVSSDSFSADLPYDYTKPSLNIKPDNTFNFKINYDPMKVKGVDIAKRYSDCIEVYCEPSLTFKALDAFVNHQGNKFIIKPKSNAVSSSYDNSTVKLSKPGEWGLSDEYFIVQKLDPKTGEKLKKPIVTRFTVKKDIAKPVISFTVDDKGVGHFTWKPVSNASNYYIIKMQEDSPAINILGSTAKTEWTTIEQDENLQKYLARGDELSSQNYNFKRFNYSEDDQRDPKHVIPEDKRRVDKNIYGVMAVTDQSASALTVIGADEIEKRLPYCKAYNAITELKANVRDIKTFDLIPTQIPITLADGTTVLRPITLNVDKIRKGEKILADQDKKGNISNRRVVATCVIPYTIEGTMFKGEYRIESPDEKNYRSEVLRVAEKIKEAQVMTGETTAYTYSTEKKDLSSLPISRTEPEVPYKIYATNSLTKYLAANMIAGNTYIDLSKHISETNGITAYDASNEALAQNPYILGVKSFNYMSEYKILEVEYKVSSKEQRQKEQKAIFDEVERVTAKIITKGMSDEQKVKAINDYICNTAQYDYDAKESVKNKFTHNFLNAWTPAGILFDKKAVCGGYAVTFKVLADRAGLESMYVTGYTNGEYHAWNKVRVNGVWRVIDVTWNDTRINPNKYYLLTDNEANKTRSQDDRFVIDILVDNYAAN